MRLSVLDQSPIIRGHDARRAIEETLALARRADELGYYRYWLAEHHAIAALADPCPEALVARLAEHAFKPVGVQPEVPTAPEVWLLGSSDYSGALAAQLGLPFSFAHFINPQGGDEVARYYRQNFKPGREPAPRTMVCTFLICAE